MVVFIRSILSSKGCGYRTFFSSEIILSSVKASITLRTIPSASPTSGTPLACSPLVDLGPFFLFRAIDACRVSRVNRFVINARAQPNVDCPCYVTTGVETAA